MYRPLAKLIILFLTILTLSGCSGTKAYRTQKELITRNEVYEESELLKNIMPMQYLMVLLEKVTIKLDLNLAIIILVQKLKLLPLGEYGN